MSRKYIDWDGIEESYKSTTLPVRAIAKAYDVNHSTILKKAKKYGWTRISSIKEVTKKVTTEISGEIADRRGEVTNDEAVIAQLRAQLDGVFATLFFDVVREEMRKKYYTYDYFSVFVAAEYFERMMKMRKYIPADGIAISKNGQSYVSGEMNVYISMASNFMKAVKDIGLSPTSRGRATLRIVESAKEKSLFDLGEIASAEEVDL